MKRNGLIHATVAVGLAGTVFVAWSVDFRRPGGDMVLVPGGPAVLGGIGPSSMPGPVLVDLPSFQIDRFEVTNAQYAAFSRATRRSAPAFADDPAYNADALPVTGVTRQDAADYCRWAGKRLPSEHEWEKAARGADGRSYPWGDAPAGAHVHLAGAAPAPVGSMSGDVSPYGVHDMAGNVSEWVADLRMAGQLCSGQTASGGAAAGGATAGGVTAGGAAAGSSRPLQAYIRGNSFQGLPHQTVLHHHLWDDVDTFAEFVGFRCARSVTEPRRAPDSLRTDSLRTDSSPTDS